MMEWSQSEKLSEIIISACILFEESVFIFQFLNDEIHSYVLFDIIVNFIIQKLKNKHTFLKNIQTEKAEESLI